MGLMGAAVLAVFFVALVTGTDVVSLEGDPVVCCTTKTTESACEEFACNNAAQSKCENTNCDWNIATGSCEEVEDCPDPPSSCCESKKTETECLPYACETANTKACGTAGDNCVWDGSNCVKDQDSC